MMILCFERSQTTIPLALRYATEVGARRNSLPGENPLNRSAEHGEILSTHEMTWGDDIVYSVHLNVELKYCESNGRKVCKNFI